MNDAPYPGAVFDAEGRFHGFGNGEHRTVGPHRAWCHECGEWCYPTIPCTHEELPRLEERIEELEAGQRALWEELNERQAIVRELEANNERLREALRDQWEVNHDEHCSSEWPHPLNKRHCAWPMPDVLREEAR